MIRVFVDPIPTLGIAMRRVSLALRVTCPPWARIVDSVSEANVQVLHPVALNARKHLRAPHYAVMMHCLDAQQDPNGSGDNVPIVVPERMEPWAAVWGRALVVWSYYDLSTRKFKWSQSAVLGNDGSVLDVTSHDDAGLPRFYHAPLGVDGDTFRLAHGPRDVGIITTGHVSGPRAEAIEEAAIAAHRAGLTTAHLGPSQVAGMTAHVPGWSAVSDLGEGQLAALYGRSLWVSGLRHAEGFELPVLEGLACGARPICFDLPCYRTWFDGHAVFVPEASGEELIASLAEVMSEAPSPVTPEERDAVLRRFDWRAIGRGFWQALERACLSKSELQPLVAPAPETSRPKLELVKAKRRVLWVGDSPTTDWTGFGRASFHICEALRPDWDLHVLGTTHDGYPYDRDRHPYDVYPFSKGMVAKLVTDLRPDVVVLQHDPWQVQAWLREAGNATTVGIMPIDGKNCRCDYLNGLALAIWWTKFAENEARLGGYVGQSTVIPLGVDLDTYVPIDRKHARARLGIPAELADAFIVGVVARNQPRKRLDLAVRHFAEWVQTHDVRDAWLYVQTAPTGECAYDVSELMRYERLSNRLIHVEPKARQTMSEAAMAHVYSSLDVFFYTTQGEGWGLPAMEAMACGTPVIAPDWSALGDWARGAAHLVPCSDISATINPMAAMSRVKIGVLGGVPDKAENVKALDRVYRDPAYRAYLADRGRALVERPEFRWEAIGRAFSEAIAGALAGPVRLGPAPVPEEVSA